jgi:hypothetical protein
LPGRENIFHDDVDRQYFLKTPLRLKGDPAKMAIASRLRQETILSVKWIAHRLHLGTPKSVRPRLRTLNRTEQQTPSAKAIL